MAKSKQSNFNLSKMTHEEKVKEYKKLAKRANVRIKALQQNHFDKYNSASSYLDSIGREKFPESGKPFFTEKLLNEAFSQVQSFLNNKTTTISGIKKNTSNNGIKTVYDYETLKKMNYKDKVEQARRLSNIANSRMKTLEKNNVDYYAIEKAKHFLNSLGRETFYTGRNYKSKKELRMTLQALSEFVNSKSSTMKGLREIRKARVTTFSEKFDIDLTNKDDERNFFEFLNSQQFLTLSGFADSEDIIDDFAQALNQGFTKEEIQLQYQDFLITDMTFEQVAERRNGKPMFK